MLGMYPPKRPAARVGIEIGEKHQPMLSIRNRVKNAPYTEAF